MVVPDTMGDDNHYILLPRSTSHVIDLQTSFSSSWRFLPFTFIYIESIHRTKHSMVVLEYVCVIYCSYPRSLSCLHCWHEHRKQQQLAWSNKKNVNHWNSEATIHRRCCCCCRPDEDNCSRPSTKSRHPFTVMLAPWRNDLYEFLKHLQQHHQ
jgi:hypothetical protein